MADWRRSEAVYDVSARASVTETEALEARSHAAAANSKSI